MRIKKGIKLPFKLAKWNLQRGHRRNNCNMVCVRVSVDTSSKWLMFSSGKWYPFSTFFFAIFTNYPMHMHSLNLAASIQLVVFKCVSFCVISANRLQNDFSSFLLPVILSVRKRKREQENAGNEERQKKTETKSYRKTQKSISITHLHISLSNESHNHTYHKAFAWSKWK